MAKAVVFATNGLMPIEALTMVGVNSKPNSTNPIGFFGTGLKYAIAVCLRLGCKVTIFIGTTEYVFEVRQEEFREKQFDFVYFKKKKQGWLRSKSTKLPFTLEYGKTWEIWQAYRELHTNTLDEGGEIFVVDISDTNQVALSDDLTSIVVEGEAFLQAYYDRFKTFLPEGLRERNSVDGLQILDKPSQHIYYRGMRVHDLPKDTTSVFTYNFVRPIDLTEDRTAKYPWLLETWITEAIVTSDNETFVRGVLQAPVGSFETKLNSQYANTPPSDTFRRLSKYRGSSVGWSSSYIGRYTPAPPPPKHDLRSIVQSFVDLSAQNLLPAYTEEIVDCAKLYLDGTYEGL